jgi:hypothetical protein
MCFNEVQNEVHIGRHLSDSFPFQNGLKQGGVLSPLLLNVGLEHAIRKVQGKSGGIEFDWDTSAFGLC